MSLYFITGNKGKLAEAQAIIPEMQGLDIELLEIQDIDPEVIIKAKLQSAFNHHQGEFIVEDTSLHLDCLNGLPGPLIKWFLKTVGLEGLYNIADKLGNNKATAKCIIGYAKDKNDIQFFEGAVEGRIVAPRGEGGFGWDAIFQPNGYNKTYAEMDAKTKNEMSHRRLALNNLKATRG